MHEMRISNHIQEIGLEAYLNVLAGVIQEMSDQESNKIVSAGLMKISMKIKMVHPQ
jgi:hypothetical protein